MLANGSAGVARHLTMEAGLLAALPTGIGAPVRRIEDLRLLRGHGRFGADVAIPGLLHMAILRSPHAAARIEEIDTRAARAMPGVVAVLTAADLLADGIGGLHTMLEIPRPDGSPMPRPPYHALAVDEVRFVGDAVAVVVAETRAMALDGVELIELRYAPRDAVMRATLALRPGAPIVWPDRAPDNRCFVYEAGDRAATDAAFAGAHHVSRFDFRISRLTAAPMETRNATALIDPADGRVTLISGTQDPHRSRRELAERAFGIDTGAFRLISPDMGGSFGMRGCPYPEHILVVWAARRLGRPVRWAATRSEGLMSDFHARDNDTTAELALDARGRFLGLRVRTIANLGAYLALNTINPAISNIGGLAGVYTTPAIHVQVQGAFTNTQPTAPYRGAGRPEATYAIERLIDRAAAEMGIDRIELRRRNLIPESAMPFRTGLVFTYDSGAFERNMDKALKAADWEGFPARRVASEARGLLRGIGLANAIEIAGGPAVPGEEFAELRFDDGGSLTMLLGGHSHGQGHETVFRQVAASLLGLPPERVRVLFGDTDQVQHGRGTFGSRTIATAGHAVHRAAERIIARGRQIAAHLLEAAETDIGFADGSFSVVGTDRRVSLIAVARASFAQASMPPGSELGLSAMAMLAPKGPTFPNSVHVCEAEIDPATGQTRIVAYTVVDDVGTVINPLLLKGQLHGGVAQGLGQVLSESVLYDDTGQLLTASFMDYALPRADEIPPVAVISAPVPTAMNALGSKGAGEAGCVGALPAAMNAIVDALAPLGVTELDMPATPARVWQAMRDAARRSSSLI